ncbi:DUF502 domain-containing protein [Endozoicomonas sp. SM1973]|uniref:DUF502 domain-containing protein n=1 Tax=Spartinivicinus marinus TaxID=2994442 RepID=A0A853IGV1_9GAMM|nr:DUF502 domain-containing protein [Spartinivicinus marinus]MCX4026152.1 DUF502 domain-containing protein [Spartinivicinus marinus]NYZ68687.1 DUF502 domain-containing protein [Spartinivicinus marinus]
MEKLRAFIKQSLIGGILILLPIVILGAVFRWVFYFVTDLIQPMTDYMSAHYHLPELVADIAVIALIMFACFAIGTLVSTSVGTWIHSHFDKYLDKLAPGYRIIKEIVSQIVGDPNSSPFTKGEVVRVQLFGETCETTVTAIVTARHEDDTVTIFMPTGPNPTSGNIYHVPEKLVTYYPDASVEKMMKSIIACGAGSDSLFTSNNKS